MLPDLQTTAAVPFHFWSVVFFVFGCMAGSFYNVCIHRMPRGESIVSPPSHCPHCGYSIPWWLNLPLFTWLLLRGRCANCRAPISVRYLLVEFLTGLIFLACWLVFGEGSASLALAYCLLLSLFIIATFIDFEHFIIPDEITLGGIGAGFLCAYAVPLLHQTYVPSEALRGSFWGIAVGGGLVYGIVRGGKLLFGRQKFSFAPDSKIVFTETALCLPDQTIPYEELFYRKSDTIVLTAKRIELIDRCYGSATLRLSPTRLRIDDDTFDPETVPHLEAVADGIVLPREAMGFGDVKFMAAIGAFLGWPAVVFSLMVSSLIGACVGVVLILSRKREWSSRLPYGPYIALAATIWIFGSDPLHAWWLERVRLLTSLFLPRG